tara:strand:- start:155 stop:484 length:330 start_codon:yes stop_codon:yes gene_type:complete
VSNHLATIKVSACEQLVSLKRKYLSIGLHSLKVECSKEHPSEELVLSMCHFIVAARSLVSVVERLLQKREGGTIKVTASEASIIKTHLRIFKLSKEELSCFFNFSVEIH